MFYEFLFHQISLILTPANDNELKLNLKGFYSFFVDKILNIFIKLFYHSWSLNGEFHYRR